MRKMLVGEITKAIYGTLLGEILFYKKLQGVLLDMGFQTNKTNECTFNKMINEHQCTIQERVDVLKLSNVEQSELNKIIYQLNEFSRYPRQQDNSVIRKNQGVLGNDHRLVN